jgi:hypothetical protein
MHSQEPPWLPYQGWPNAPTWEAYCILTSYEDTRLLLEGCKADADSIRAWLEEEARRFVAAQPVARGIAALLQDWATDPARRIDWSRVAAALQGEGADCTLTSLEAATVEALRSVGLELPTDSLTSLPLWWENLASRWAERSELRRQPSALGVLAQHIIDSYLQAVDWHRLAKALRGE